MLKSFYRHIELRKAILHFNIKKTVILFTSLVVLTSLSAFAIEDVKPEKDSKLTLSDCVKIAIKNSPTLKKDKYNYEMSKHNVSIAKAVFFPRLAVGTGYNLTDTRASNISNNSSVYSAEASLNMLIFNFGKANANINMRKFNMIAALYNFNADVLTTIIEVRTNYYAVLAAKATVDINKAYVDINERNYQRTKAYFDEGIKSKIDLVNAEVNLSDSKVSLVEAEKAYENAMVNLNNSMYIAFAPKYEIEPTETFNLKDNLYIVSLQELDKVSDLSVLPEEIKDATHSKTTEKTEILDGFKFEPYPYSFEESVEMAYNNRSIIKSYKATLDAMKENLKYVKREYFPEISASTGYGFRDTNSTNSFNVGVNLSSSVNILSKKHEIDNAKLQVALAENDLVQIKQDMYFAVQAAYISMVDIEKQIPLLAVKVRQTLENFELADGRYSVGLGDYIELQDAKVQYNNAQHKYVEAIYKYNVARTTLEGLIAAPQLVTINIEDYNK